MPGLNVTGSLRDRARALGGSVALPEATEPRTIAAARRLTQSRVARPVLVGDARLVLEACRKGGLNPARVEIVDPMRDGRREELAERLYLRRRERGMTREEARDQATCPLVYGGLLLAAGEVDACVAGAVTTTPEVIRAGLYTVGPAEGTTTVSGAFLMVLPRLGDRINRPLLYADAGVVPEPTAGQLADIAATSAETFRRLAGEEPKVALLSFSTRGSAGGPAVERVQAAVQMLRDRRVDFAFDGELQLDAALVPDVGRRKAPDSPVAGSANVFIFPCLDAGNIGYKLTERMARATALGPLLQGLARPLMDLSRGCTDLDIELVCACALLLGS